METELLALNTTGKTLIVVTDNNYTAIINPDGFVDINVADLKDSRQIKHMLEKGWLRIEPAKQRFTDEIEEEIESMSSEEESQPKNSFEEEIEDMYLNDENESENLSNEDAWEKVREMIKTEVDNTFVRHNMNQNDQIELLQNQVDALISYKSIEENNKIAIPLPMSEKEKFEKIKNIKNLLYQVMNELKELC